MRATYNQVWQIYEDTETQAARKEIAKWSDGDLRGEAKGRHLPSVSRLAIQGVEAADD